MPTQTLPPPDAIRALKESLAGIGFLLKRGIGSWVGRGPETPLQVAAFWRVNRWLSRLSTILFLLAQGRLPRTYPPRSRRPRAEPPAAAAAPAEANGAAEAPSPPPAKPRPMRLPRRPGWLLGRGQGEINAASSQLRTWLADPATRAVLEQVPQFRAPLAALCRMLLIAPWPERPERDFPPDPPRRRTPRPPKPRRMTRAQCRAWCYANYRNSEIDAGLVEPGKRPWWMPPRGHPWLTG